MDNIIYNLTNPQKNIWDVERVTLKGSLVNQIIGILRFNGTLDTLRTQKALNFLIKNNNSFQLKFMQVENVLNQYLVPYEHYNVSVKTINDSDLSAEIDKFRKIPLSLDRLFIFNIVYSSNSTFIFFKAHHLIADGWSSTLIGEKFKEAYNKIDNVDEISTSSYLDFLNREVDYKSSKKYLADYEFWQEYVKSISPVKVLPTSDNLASVRWSQPISSKLYSKISAFCKNNQITEYSFFLAIFSIYFNKIYSLANPCFGTVFLNRQKKYDELSTIGMFVSTLPLVVNVSEFSEFSELCKNIGSKNLSIFRHSKFPYSEIQNLFNKHHQTASNTFEIGFSFQAYQPETPINENDCGEYNWVFSGEQNNPLNIHIADLNNEKSIYYDFQTSCFSQDEISKMNEIILHLIGEALNNTNKITDFDVLPEYDKKMLSKFNKSGNVTNIPQNVMSIFKDVVRTYSNKVAIKFDDTSITYSELDKRVNVVANALRGVGVTYGSPVALYFDESIEMIVAMLAVLKIGGCYVPILPDEEESRINYILNDCKPRCVLSHKNYDIRISYKTAVINLDKLDYSRIFDIDTSKILPDNPAYIIYTSGSTGNPKGTIVMHKNICGLYYSIKNDANLKASNRDVSISLLKYSFDASGIDIYSSLLFGGTLILVNKKDKTNPKKVIELLEKEKVTRTFVVPKWIEQIASQDKLLKSDLSSLKILGTGGESLKPDTVKSLLSKYEKLKIINLYGPTETTMFTTYKIVDENDVSSGYVSIGTPTFGARCAIVNNNLEFLPLNAKGELIIFEDSTSIQNISKGYLNLPDQTSKRFVQLTNPITGDKVNAYRTGDIARINDSLHIDFLGRNDDVIKVSGSYLVALNEVQSRIERLLGDDFVVFPIAVPYKTSNEIILFLETKLDSINLDDIKNHIAKNVSFYMIPKKVIILKEFPRNSSGKINRKLLKEQALKLLNENSSKVVAPKTKIEKEIYNYIKSMTNINNLSIYDDFIDDLAFDSLSLTSIFSYLEKYKLSIQDIYNNSNIKDLASFIENKTTKELLPNIDNINKVKILNNVKPFDLSNVLLTGVTGFLGAHILRELLNSTSVKHIYCIVRDSKNANYEDRFYNVIEYYFDNNKNILDLIKKKVTLISGDLSKSNFELGKKVYDELSNNVTTVINSAANVKHFIKYSQIEKDNVISVQKLIDFCKDNISLAHISTLSIAGIQTDLSSGKIYTENTLYMGQNFNNNPYLVSKFNAERLILEATSSSNLNAIIFRLGNIMPRMSDGKFQKNADTNAFLMAIKAIVDSKVISRDLLSLPLEFSPVDLCAEFILKLLINNSSQSIYHILNDKCISVLELKTLLKFFNAEILEVDLNTFISAVGKNASEYTKEYILRNNLNNYNLDITLHYLDQLNLHWPQVDAKYMKKLFNIIKGEIANEESK